MSDVRLNLGCYDSKYPLPYKNIDVRPECGPDVVDNMVTLENFESETVDEIVVIHALEHLNIDDAKAAVKRWYEVLKPGGLLRVAVPDFDALCRRYLYNQNVSEVSSAILGSNKHSEDRHFELYDENKLRHRLEYAGFTDISRYDWWETDHAHVDDFSQAYMPPEGRDIKLSHSRVQFGNGLLISLNMEGRK